MSEKPAVKRHKREQFTTEEDLRLVKLIQKYGTGNWKFISSQMGKRNVRQCKDRWENYLSPYLNKKEWTEEENQILIQKYKEFGSRWKEIATFFANRTQINVRNQVLRLIKEGKCQQIHSSHSQDRETTTSSEQSSITPEKESTPQIPQIDKPNTLHIPPPNVISPNTVFPTFPFTSTDGKLLTIEHNPPMLQVIRNVPEYCIKQEFKNPEQQRMHEVSEGYVPEATVALYPIISDIIAKSSELPDTDDQQEF